MTLERVYRLRSGDVLASMRKSAGLPQRALAEAAGVTRGAISHLELGLSTAATRANAEAIAHRLGVPLAALFDLPLTEGTPPHASAAPLVGTTRRRTVGAPDLARARRRAAGPGARG